MNDESSEIMFMNESFSKAGSSATIPQQIHLA